MLGVTPKTLREWDKNGKLKPEHVSESGYLYYSQAQVNEILRKNESVNRIVVGYAPYLARNRKTPSNVRLKTSEWSFCTRTD